MKVVALNGSPHVDGNTYFALSVIQEQFRENNVEMDIMQLGTQKIQGCMGCNQCGERKDGKCVINTDMVNPLLGHIKDADGLILASPVYYGGVNGTLKSALDRLFFVNFTNGGLFRHKVGASVVALRRSGAVSAFEEMNRYFLNSDMIVTGSNYWNIIHGLDKGDATNDAEGIQCLRVLANNMAWVMKSLDAARDSSPSSAEKVFTNFVR